MLLMRGMNGNEHVKFAILLVLLISLFCASPSSCEARPASPAKGPPTSSSRQQQQQPRQRMTCAKENRPFWLRNSCFDGFVTVHDKKVLAQHEGLDQHSREVELVKETCKDVRSGFLDPFMIRLFHPKSHGYICFNRRGRVKVMSKRRAEKMGKLCAFYESPSETTTADSDTSIPPIYIHLRSAHNRDWYLGFNGRPKRITRTTAGQAVTLPRPMLDQMDQNRRRHFRPEKCDFRFSTGEYSVTDVRSDWKGLFDHILRKEEELETNSVELTSAASSSAAADPEPHPEVAGSVAEGEGGSKGAISVGTRMADYLEKELLGEEEDNGAGNGLLQDVDFEKASELLHSVEKSLVPDVTLMYSPSSEFLHPLVSPTGRPKNAINKRNVVKEKTRKRPSRRNTKINLGS